MKLRDSVKLSEHPIVQDLDTVGFRITMERSKRFSEGGEIFDNL
jgi:hypothetical protein